MSTIPNLIYRNSNKEDVPQLSHPLRTVSFVRTSREIEANSIDENPIDWNLFPKTFYTPTTFMRTARGCSFACAFCNFPFSAGSLTHASIEIVEQEMKQLYRAGVKHLVFIDDTFNIPLARFKKILKMMLANRFNFRWCSFFRCSNADDETFDLMKESGCLEVHLGIESGDQCILNNMNKGSSIMKYKYGIRQLKERDILTNASFIVGFPGETEEAVQNTIRFIEETQPIFYHLHLYFYDTNTPIAQKAEQFGLRGSAYNWRHNTMDWKEAYDMIAMMRKTIKGSMFLCTYMFGVWAIPYLLGKGISLKHLKEFIRLSQPILLKNFDSRVLMEDEERQVVYQQLFSVGRKIAHDLE